MAKWSHQGGGGNHENFSTVYLVRWVGHNIQPEYVLYIVLLLLAKGCYDTIYECPAAEKKWGTKEGSREGRARGGRMGEFKALHHLLT